MVPRRVVRNLFHGNLLDVLPEVEEPEEQIHEAVQNQGQWKMLKNRWRKLPKFNRRNIEMLRRLSGFNKTVDFEKEPLREKSRSNQKD